MLTAPGRGLSPLSSAPRFAVFDFMSSLPAPFTCTRADTVATRRDNTGRLVPCASNAPRIDHDINGIPRGLLIEGGTQNKLTIYNANPTATTNWAKGGDSASTFTVADDPAALLATARLELLCTGGKLYKLDNSSGSGDAWVTSTAAFGTASVHTISAWIHSTGGQAQLTRTGTAPAALTIPDGAGLMRYSLPLTPDATDDQMRILARPGAVVYFILPQMEANPFPTSVIVTSGAAATRQTDRIRIAAMASALWFDAHGGYMTARYKPAALQPADAAADQFILCLHNNATANMIGTRVLRGNAHTSFRLAVASASVGPFANTVPRFAGTVCATGASWSASQAYIIDGGRASAIAPSSFPPADIVELSLGTRNNGNEPLYGWLQTAEIGAGFQPPSWLGGRLYAPADILAAGGGQSLMGGYFSSQADNSAAGRDKFIETLSALRPDAAIAFINGATGGTYASLTSTTVENADYWWDLATGTPGPILNAFHSQIAAAGAAPNVILWAQGEADSSRIPAYTTKTQYKDALLAIFAHMRQRYGGIPVIVQQLGRRTGTWTNTGGPQAVREAQQELCDTHDWIHRGPEIYDQGLHDAVHMDNAGYVAVAQRLARKLHNVRGGNLPGVDGPRIVAATRSGASIAVTLVHDGGTDFAPASGISGFSYFDGSHNPIAISAAVRTDATTVTLTLASAASGTLYYGYDAMTGLDAVNILRDNAPMPMPLRTAKIAVT